MFFYVITGIIGFNTSFYTSFAFISLETHTNYYWILSYFWEFYIKSNVLNLIFIGIDYKKAWLKYLKLFFLIQNMGYIFNI